MNLPIDFINRTQSILSSDYLAFEAALDEDSPVSIRLNRHKTDVALSLQEVPWCETGYYLDERPNFTFDPLFHAGAYYVQEASSMFLEQAIKQHIKNPTSVLDLCAAPGGKSTHIRSLLPDDCLLVANELIRNRAHILAENLMKWGDQNVIVTQSKASDFTPLKHLFDAIIVDAPCSGEGMFRKDAGAINEWSLQNVMKCAHRQQEIIKQIWNALRPGGIFIYSTCTYNLEENEQNVRFIMDEMGAQALSVDILDKWNIQPSLKEGQPSYRFFPHSLKGEGFFLAVLRKLENEERYTIKQPKNKNKKVVIKVPEQARCWVVDDEKYIFEVEQNKIHAFPKLFENVLNILKSQCNVLHYGILLAEIKGKDLILNQSMALSNALNRDQFTIVDLDYKTAINYLKNETLVLDDSLPKGYILITYKEVPLGWVKNLANRANNLYPQEWRIRTSYFPENLKLIW